MTVDVCRSSRSQWGLYPFCATSICDISAHSHRASATAIGSTRVGVAVSARSHGAIATANCIKNSNKMALHLAMMG